MKWLILLFIPLIAFAQVDPQKESFPFFSSGDTLFASDSLTSGWQEIGTSEGSVTFGIILDALGDSVAALTFKAQVCMSGFETNGAFDDSIAVDGANPGWMNLGTIDSVAIADSLAWYFPLSSEAWWHYVDKIRFKILSGAAVDTIKVDLCKLRRR